MLLLSGLTSVFTLATPGFDVRLRGVNATRGSNRAPCPGSVRRPALMLVNYLRLHLSERLLARGQLLRDPRLRSERESDLRHRAGIEQEM